MLLAALSRVTVPLWIRLGVPGALIIGMAIGLISFLNYANYEKTYRELHSSRVGVVARDIRQAIEAGFNLGLAPRANTQLSYAIAAARDHTEGLRFAAIIDQAGRRLVEAGVAKPNQDWSRRLIGNTGSHGWTGEDRDTYQIGLPFRNSFGVVVGAVILGYDKSAIDHANAAMRRSLFETWWRTTLVLSMVMLFGVRWITRRLDGELKAVETVLDRSRIPAPSSEPATLVLPVLGSGVGDGIQSFIAQSRSISQQLGATRSARSP